MVDHFARLHLYLTSEICLTIIDINNVDKIEEILYNMKQIIATIPQIAAFKMTKLNISFSYWFQGG